MNKPFSNQFTNDSFIFSLEISNGMLEFNHVAIKCKEIATYINSVINNNIKLVVASIHQIENSNNYRLKLILGNVDETIDLTAIPTPQTISGDHNWSYGSSLNFNLGCQPSDLGAVRIINELGSKLLLDHRNYGINQLAIGAPPGYEIYFNHFELVEYGGINEFSSADVSILSKFDWDPSYTAYCQQEYRTPNQSPIFYIDTESDNTLTVTFPCQILIDAFNYGFKCCINEPYLNYIISKVDDVYEFVSPNNQYYFTGFIITPYETDVHNGPIQHKYQFTKSTPHMRASNTNVTL